MTERDEQLMRDDEQVMRERDERARGHDDENSNELAIRKAHRRMAHEERELEREMSALQHSEARAEHQIEEELLREHWGHQPERPPVWPNRGEPHRGK